MIKAAEARELADASIKNRFTMADIYNRIREKAADGEIRCCVNVPERSLEYVKFALMREGFSVDDIGNGRSIYVDWGNHV